jgi:uncharacterized protein YbgA (DUF1722 family)/uncharacterized protein YbbK (DUF523 family)
LPSGHPDWIKHEGDAGFTTLKKSRTPGRIPVGISSCLLGESVRYDGGHKFDITINTCLGEWFEFRPFCPEVAIGLGIPRDPIQVVRSGAGLAVRGIKHPEQDFTQALAVYGKQVADVNSPLCGYIFKARSPSCGLRHVRTVDETGSSPKSNGIGAYAAALTRARPNLPVIEEGTLADKFVRDNFVEQVRVFHRWQQLLAQDITPARLVDFHTRHKLTLMAHNQAACRRLGKLVASVTPGSMSETSHLYESELMGALRRPATRRNHTNVLQHLQGFFSKHLDPNERAELTRAIEHYRLGDVELEAPLSLFRKHCVSYPHDWVQRQAYLDQYLRDS